MTLHLTVTRLSPYDPANSTPATTPARQVAQDAEPYLVQLEPCRPVPGVVSSVATANTAPSKRDPGLEQMVQFVQTASERIEGVRWETGRA